MLHPAENRGYRELYAFARQLADHWEALAERSGGRPEEAPLAGGAAAARELIEELEPVTGSRGLHGRPAAQGVGSSLAKQRTGLRDRFLERNQAVRFAVEEMQHLVTLLSYLGSVAAGRGDEELGAFCARWVRKLKRHENAARKAAAALGRGSRCGHRAARLEPRGPRGPRGRLRDGDHGRVGRPQGGQPPRRRLTRRARQRPFHSGARFSANARTPSRKSSLRKQDSRSSTSSRSSSAGSRPGCSRSARMIRLLPASDSGALAAISAASSSAALLELLRLHHLVHEPDLPGARSASTLRPDVEELGGVGHAADLDELARAPCASRSARAWPAACRA